VNPQGALYLQGFRTVKNRRNLYWPNGVDFERLRYSFFLKVTKKRGHYLSCV